MEKNILEQLLFEVESFDLSNLEDLQDPVVAGEEVLGDLPEDLKPLYGLMCATAETLKALHEEMDTKIKKYILQHRLGGADIGRFKKELDPEFTSKHLKAHTRHSILKNTFWYELRTRFPLAGGRNLGIREGFKVVAYEEQEEDPLSALFDGLGGSIIVTAIRRGR